MILPEGKKTKDYNVTIQAEMFGKRGASDVDLLTVKVCHLMNMIFRHLDGVYKNARQLVLK